nr:hypothetical protein CFP56_42959 [Quercus suber]
MVSGMGNDFGGDDIPAKSNSGGGAGKVAADPPSHSGTEQISNNPSVVSTDFAAPMTHNSHAGIISSISESCPCLDSTNMSAGIDLFEVQIQTIDQELNKYDNHTNILPDTRDMGTVFSSNINDIAQVPAQKSEALITSPTSPIISRDQEKSSETRDLSLVPPNLRTWKRMVRQNCMDEQTMHAQVTGKRSSEIDTELVNNLKVDPIVVQIDRLDLVLQENSDLDAYEILVRRIVFLDPVDFRSSFATIRGYHRVTFCSKNFVGESMCHCVFYI